MVKDTPYDRIHFPSESTSTNSSPLTTPLSDSGEPLYTEIRIPLPKIAQPPTSTSTSRYRAHTLASSFSPFHKRRSSSPSAGKNLEKEKEKRASTGSMMKDLVTRKKRSGTVDALAVLPAVLIMSAELFTPEEEEKKNGKGD
jgi:hypothetical protein